MDWDGVVLHPKTRREIARIEYRVRDELVPTHGRGTGVGATGVRVLFHGPAGTGKTLAAARLGEAMGRPVYRVDLSRVVSTYIGETEKNLSRLLAEAREKDWILFFDEADALFGKRTGIRDAHDTYANQEVAYLLDAIETHPGPVIMATRRDDIDDEVRRHFQSCVRFLTPGRR